MRRLLAAAVVLVVVANFLFVHIESRYLQRALDRTGGVQTKAAELLKMTFRQFRYKLQKHHMMRKGSGTDA